jgi:hypothetical protein
MKSFRLLFVLGLFAVMGLVLLAAEPQVAPPSGSAQALDSI